MQLGTGAGARVERFLRTHDAGQLIVCVGSASVSGLAWLAEHTRQRPVTLLIGDLQGRNFQHATEADRRAALRFVQRSDVEVRNWYRTARNAAGRSEAHLKVWAACDEHGAPHAHLVGSANLTTAGLAENVELMTVADSTEHAYLNGVLQALLDKSWLAEDQLVKRIGARDTRVEADRPRGAASSNMPASAWSGSGARADADDQQGRGVHSASHRRRPGAPKAYTGCARRVAVLAACLLGLGAALALVVALAIFAWNDLLDFER